MKKNNYGIIVLFIILIISVISVVVYYKTLPPEVEKKDEGNKIVHTDDEINTLYEKVKMSYEKELILNESELNKLDSKYNANEFSDQFKVTLGIIQSDEKDIGTDYYYRTGLINGYRYNGTYIKASLIKEHIGHVLGSSEGYKDTTIVFRDKMYEYDATIRAYRIYVKNYDHNIKKVTHITADWDETNIYITEYSAYTYEANGRFNSFSKHQNPLPIGITEENITENLDIIDVYKYTFTYSKITDNYYLSSIERVK